MEDAVGGVLVLRVTRDGFLLDNVAVDPRYHGQGIGRALLELAELEARAKASDRSICTRTRG